MEDMISSNCNEPTMCTSRSIETTTNSDESVHFRNSNDVDIGTILWASFNGILFVGVLCGNTLTVIAIKTCRRLRAVISNLFILSLAISDFIVGLALPYHVAFYLGSDLGKSKCFCLIRFFLMIFACCVSSLTLISIAIDRYIAIVYALHYRRYMTRRVASIIITINWIGGAIIAAIPMIWNHWATAHHCEFDEILPPGYIVGVITPGYILIWTFMLLLYCRIMREASRQAKQLACCGSSDWKSIQIVVLIMGCFTICWLPYFIVVCAKTFNVYEETTLLYKGAFSLAMSNSGLNPLIYAWKNSNFRRAFTQLLCCRSPNSYQPQMEDSQCHSVIKSQHQVSMEPTVKHIYIVPICEEDKDPHTICIGKTLTSIAAAHQLQHNMSQEKNEPITCAICKQCLLEKNSHIRLEVASRALYSLSNKY